MPTFGHRLRHERESRNTPIQEVSARTHIGLRYLEALENNDFDALPGPRGFAKLYIRAYADLLGFDPESMIEEFEKERRRQARTTASKPRGERRRPRRVRYEPPPRKQPSPPPTEPQAEPALERELSPPPPEKKHEQPETAAALERIEPRSRVGFDRRILVAAAVGIVLLALAVIALRPDHAPMERLSTSTPEPSRPAGPVVEPSVDAAPPAAVAAGMRITESGVGTRVVDLQLVGETDRFSAGATAVFFTRVVDGRGRSLRHVWLHEGRVIQTRTMGVRSPDWRTYSTKTLWKQGRWSVEARDTDDRVIARAEFICTKP